MIQMFSIPSNVNKWLLVDGWYEPSTVMKPPGRPVLPAAGFAMGFKVEFCDISSDTRLHN